MNNVWLDCDPGHDDAIAILLAIHLRNINLLGVSTVHGNADAKNTAANAARCLYAFAAAHDVRVHPGASKPLLRPVRHDSEIHGTDGLGGVEGLPSVAAAGVHARLRPDRDHLTAIEALARAVRDSWQSGKGQKVAIVACGPLTNVALFLSVHPELLEGVEQVVFMGGGIGVGNRSAVAEFNILCDPEAAQIVLDANVPKTMIPLNVTHQAIVTKAIHARLLHGTSTSTDAGAAVASTNLRHTLSTLITFFKDAYETTFGFKDGPPIHDALTVAYVSDPTLFTGKRYRVDVELHGAHTAGETVADVWGYRACDDSWGATGKNCFVALELDVPRFMNLFLDCVEECDKVSPLNENHQA
ncbi:Inosine/uridine-preferring nucleoside hydrolase [Dentipellis sp. KUC8613]|nr:Inosine/uridine-preferring nucleoside hydrolase [Dentipellis sp. KUC8613]